MMEVPELPLRAWIDSLIQWMYLDLDFIFEPIRVVLAGMQGGLSDALLYLPEYVIVALVCGSLAWRRHFRTAITVGICLLLIWNLGLWEPAVKTVSLVLIATGIALGLGVPLGIAMSESDRARAVIEPILDYMQTTPAFVYLIPSVLFFKVGSVPGIIATVMFALPPPVRATAVGLEAVDKRLIEAAEAFGASNKQVLLKLKLPLAVAHIRVGINQCIMMALTMVVIASLIGAEGLGQLVVQALSTFDVSLGIEAGIGVVLLAIALDRISGSGIEPGKKN